jgi:hypothetical protein
MDLPLVSGALITTTNSTRKYPLGREVIVEDATYGVQTYRYVYNNSGASIAANLLVMKANGTSLYQVIVCGAAAPNSRVRGKTVAAIPDGYYGWVLCRGNGLFTSDGGTTANTAQKTAANGKCTDGVIGTDELPVWAMATEDPAGDGGTFIGFIDC